jgi:hypothetical protein
VVVALLAFGISSAMGPVLAGAKSHKPAKKKPQPQPHSARTVLHLEEVASTASTAGAALLMASVPQKRGCIANREVDLHVFGATGDRIDVSTMALSPGKDGHVLVAFGFPPQPGDTAFYFSSPGKMAGPVFCKPAMTAVVPLPRPSGA